MTSKHEAAVGRRTIPLGDGISISPAECLQFLAYVAFQTTPGAGHQIFAARAVHEILMAAAASGFRQAVLLETLFASRVRSERTQTLAFQATSALGDEDAFLQVLHAAGMPTGGGV